MSGPTLKFQPIPILQEFLLPISIQAVGILTLLILVRDSAPATFASIILSLIWLKVTMKQTVQEAGEIRAGRRLFSTIGTWNNQQGAEHAFDEIISETLMIDSIESEETWALVTAWGLANAMRGAMAAMLQVYLLIAVVLVAVGYYR
jgi:hypothetical protein